jgi:hypothetical protein
MGGRRGPAPGSAHALRTAMVAPRTAAHVERLVTDVRRRPQTGSAAGRYGRSLDEGRVRARRRAAPTAEDGGPRSKTRFASGKSASGWPANGRPRGTRLGPRDTMSTKQKPRPRSSRSTVGVRPAGRAPRRG